jgi:N-acetylated-alpha-linked acidic dipeptidase
VLPFEFGSVVSTFRKYVDEIEAEARKKDEVKALDLSAVRRSLDLLDGNARRFEQMQAAILKLPADRLRSARAVISQANQILYQAEQALTDDAGLPQRPWFKHLIYAPGFYTGYGVKTMPGIREAVEDRPNLQVAAREAARVAAAIERYASRVAAATARLRTITM